MVIVQSFDFKIGLQIKIDYGLFQFFTLFGLKRHIIILTTVTQNGLHSTGIQSSYDQRLLQIRRLCNVF